MVYDYAYTHGTVSTCSVRVQPKPRAIGADNDVESTWPPCLTLVQNEQKQREQLADVSTGALRGRVSGLIVSLIPNHNVTAEHESASTFL